MYGALQLGLGLTAPRFGPAYEPEAAALFARMTTQPTSARASLINDTIKAFKDGGTWSKFDWFYMMAAETAQAARLNWKSSTYAASLTARNGPVFTADRGYKGDGSAADLTVTATSPTNFSLNNGTFSVGVHEHSATLSGIMFQWWASTTRMNVSSGGSVVQARINDGTSISVVSPGKKRITINRTGASARSWIVDGALVGSDTTAATSATTATVYLLSTGTINYTADRLSYAYAGAFSDAEVIAVDAILATYLTAVGAI